MDSAQKNNGVLTILATIFLGAIGSGLWDFFLSDLFSSAGKYLISFYGSLSDNYFNQLYKNLGNGSSYPYLAAIHSFVLSLYILIPFVASRTSRPLRSKLISNSAISENPIKLKRLLISLKGILLF